MVHDQKYLNWLIRQVEPRGDPSTYTKMMEHLHRVDFVSAVGLDANRAMDGIDLRISYYKGTGRGTYPSGACSILEMMVALAIRCDKTIMHDNEVGSRIDTWFWEMIDNLGLSDQNDISYSEERVQYVLDRFSRREYASNGEGGLFISKASDSNVDMRNMEIWYQMHYYMRQNHS